MSDYTSLLQTAEQRLRDISAVPFALFPLPETLAPLWFTTPAGQQYLEALTRGDLDAALALYDVAYGNALDAWTALLWQAPFDPPLPEGDPHG